mgnify:FL=1
MSVYSLGMKENMTLPPIALNIVITASAPKAPIKTINLLYFIAIIIPKKNVLSPISQTKIARNDVVKEVKRLFS